MPRNYLDNFTEAQREALIGADVSYQRAGRRCGWTGRIKAVYDNKFKVRWTQQSSWSDDGCTTYASGALLHPEDSYIKLTNKALLMSYANTVTSGTFYMVLGQNGDQKTGMITHDQAVEKAAQLAQDSAVKEVYFVVRSDEKFFATKPPITRETL